RRPSLANGGQGLDRPGGGYGAGGVTAVELKTPAKRDEELRRLGDAPYGPCPQRRVQAPCHPVAIDPVPRSTPNFGPVKVERPTGRTTLTGPKFGVGVFEGAMVTGWRTSTPSRSRRSLFLS